MEQYTHIKTYFVEHKKISVCVLMTCIVVIFCIASKMVSSISKEIENNVIKRPGYVDNSLEYSLDVYKEGENIPYEIDFELEARKYMEREVFENFDDAYDIIIDEMLGSNESLENVTSNLIFPSKVKEYAMTVEWYSSDYRLIDYNGIVYNTDLTNQEGENVELTARLKYGEYSSSYPINVHIVPPVLNENDSFVKQVKNAIKEAKSDQYSEQVKLPETINGEKIKFKVRTTDSTGTIIVLGIIGTVAIIFGMEAQKNKEKEQRKKQLKYDYSEVVSKLTLLAGAGMTIRRAWEKIALDYKNKSECNKCEKHYAYEEMLTTYYQMQSGVSEAQAYSQFGTRCNVKEYLKLGALLEQNLIKGTRGLSMMLEKESFEAFEDRKSLAKIQGEEAGTKLLLPMGIMLVIVMVIVIVPAFLSFSI